MASPSQRALSFGEPAVRCPDLGATRLPDSNGTTPADIFPKTDRLTGRKPRMPCALGAIRGVNSLFGQRNRQPERKRLRGDEPVDRQVRMGANNPRQAAKNRPDRSRRRSFRAVLGMPRRQWQLALNSHFATYRVAFIRKGEPTGHGDRVAACVKT